MDAIQLVGTESTERPREFRRATIPQPEPGRDEALVRVRTAGVCGSDVGAYLAKRAYAFVTLPRILGHEYVGSVAEVGSAVSTVTRGDHVIERPLRSCGRCRSCALGRPNVCENVRITGFHHDGAFAVYHTVPESCLHRVPTGSAARMHR